MSASPDTPAPRTGLRIAIFAGLVVVCGIAAAVVLVRARADRPNAGRPTEATVPANSDALARMMQASHLVFRNTELGANYGKVEVADQSEPGGPRAVTPLSCNRVAMSRDVGLCLAADQGVVTTYVGKLFDRNFAVTHSFPLPGLPSRARVSRDGRYAAMTLFVYGDSYAATTFSTRTLFVDTHTGKVIGNLEQFHVTDHGRPVTAVNRNYWGVTFANDSNHFYATLAVGDHIQLISGDVARREAHTVAEHVECPSLSPDETRIAYKYRLNSQLGAVTWRLHVLDLRTGADHALAETRNIDDQVEWIDNATVTYSLPRANSGTPATETWAVPADGSGSPSIYVRGAYSMTASR